MQIAPMQRPRHLAEVQSQERGELGLRVAGSEANPGHQHRHPWPAAQGSGASSTRVDRAEAAEAAALISPLPTCGGPYLPS